MARGHGTVIVTERPPVIEARGTYGRGSRRPTSKENLIADAAAALLTGADPMENRGHTLRFRVNPEEENELRRRADEQGLTLSEYIRRKCLGG